MIKIRKKEKPVRIVSFGAHNDDSIIGAGGTLARYADEGKEIISVIFSYGEKSMPQLKKKVSISIRVKESRRADKILGCKETIYLGVEEGKFLEEAKKKKFRNILKKIIVSNSPEKIFMHSTDDAHPDHRAVNQIINSILDEINFKGEVYTFQIWNVLSFKKKDSPLLIVDVSDYFQKKVDAFKAHKSQKLAIWSLMWNVYLHAILNGFKNKAKFAEVFYKVR